MEEKKRGEKRVGGKKRERGRDSNNKIKHKKMLD